MTTEREELVARLHELNKQIDGIESELRDLREERDNAICDLIEMDFKAQEANKRGLLRK